MSTPAELHSDANGATPALSLVIPAYNEAGRIGGTLAKSQRFLESRPFAWEIIVADDGSTDATSAIARSFAATDARIRVVSIRHGGKAAALRAGMSAANGVLIAFSDADLATPLDYLDQFIEIATAGADIVAGSREGANANRIGEPWVRHLMGRVFNRLVQWLLIPGVEDTQCGFKLFRRRAALELLRSARLYDDERSLSGARVTAFDVELFAIARLRHFQVVMVPVTWTYGEQSKVNPLRDSFHNLKDVLTVFVNLRLGRYRELPAEGPQRDANRI